MSTREITKEQFSNNTTIDGSRIESALADVQDRINSVPFRNVDCWTENKFCWGFTPKLGAGLDQAFEGGPFSFIFRSEMPNAYPSGEAPNNHFRFKGASILDPNTGLPVGRTNTYDLSWFWTSTQYFTTPSIIKDFTVFGIFDDRTDRTIALNESWFTNDWKNSGGTFLNDFHLWILVDNPLNVGDTFIRNAETHTWGASSVGLLMNPHPDEGAIPTTYISGGQVQYNPTFPNANVQKINANAVRLHNLNIPVFSNSRVRFVLGLPATGEPRDAEIDVPGQGDGAYDNTNNAHAGSLFATFANNIWSMNVSVLEPLEKK